MARSRAHALVFALVAHAWAVPGLEAQSRISTSVDTTLVTVGDRVTLTVTVEHDPAATVRWPDSVSLAPFEVLEGRALPTRREDGTALSGLRLSLAAFELGTLEVPAFEVRVETAGGSTETLSTDRYVVEVQSVGADEGGDIREIRGPLGIPVGPLGIVIGLLLLLVPALLAFFLYRRLRPRRDDDRRGVRGAPPRPAHEIALEELRALQASQLPEQGRVKDFHIRVSEILRTYVERRFRVDALEMTSHELLRALERAGVDETFHDGLRRFLTECDLVKFAKARPDAERARRTLELARELVESTIPRVPIPDVDEPGNEPGDEPGDEPREERAEEEPARVAATARAGAEPAGG